jgi:hypothetical protein
VICLLVLASASQPLVEGRGHPGEDRGEAEREFWGGSVVSRGF